MSEIEKTAPNEIYLIVGDTDKGNRKVAVKL